MMEYKVAFVTGIFHAHDPLNIAQHHNTEYQGIASSFSLHFYEKMDVRLEDVKAWFTDMQAYGFDTSPCFEKLCISLHYAVE